MALIVKIASQFDMQAEFMKAGRSGEGIDLHAFIKLAESLINEEVNTELLPAVVELRECLQSCMDYEAINPGAALPVDLREQLLSIYTEVADGIVDSVYVLFQLAHTLHIPFDACYIEVHRSNMSKFVVDPVTSELIVVKDANGKILKGPYYSKPQLREIIAQVIFRTAQSTMAEPPAAPAHVDHTQTH